MTEVWSVFLVMDGDEPLELSREPSLKRALARAAAEIREGRYGDGARTTRPGEVRLAFLGGEVIVQQEGAPRGPV